MVDALVFVVALILIGLFELKHWGILLGIALFFILFAVLAFIMKKTKTVKFEYTEEFEKVYQKMKNLFGKEYEKNKKKLRTFIITFFALLVGFLCFFIVLLNLDKMLAEWKVGIMYGMFFAFFITEGICLYKIIKLQLINKKTYETFLLPIFISDIDNNLKYKKKLPAIDDGYIEQRYIDSGIENKKYDVFDCEDFVTRRIRWCNTF